MDIQMSFCQLIKKLVVRWNSTSKCFGNLTFYFVKLKITRKLGRQ